MSLLKQFLGSSLMSRERLLQAREFYFPTRDALAPEVDFARWTQRVAVQSDLGSARELAGLSDEELTVLENEFVRCQERPRTDRLRHAVPAGAALAALGGLGLAVQSVAFGLGESAYRAPQLVSVTCLLIGLCALAVGVLASFGMVHLQLSHGTTGLYIGRLDEQHPWLHQTLSLSRYPAAEEYRQRVLRDRGPLRGVDYLIMREVVRAHEALELTRTTRSVAEQLQLQGTPAETRAAGPRLVRVGSRSRH